MADIPRADVQLWRTIAQNAWPTGTFARYLNASPQFLARKFGQDPIEEWQLAMTFARICSRELIIRQGQANWILMNQNLFGTQLRGALINQQALNLLVTNCPEIELGGNAAMDLGAQMEQEGDEEDEEAVQGAQRRQRIGGDEEADPDSLYGGGLAFRQGLWAQESYHR